MSPACSTTNQRDASSGACFIATGDSNVRPGNERGVETPTLQLGDGTGGGGESPPPPQATDASAKQIGNGTRGVMAAPSNALDYVVPYMVSARR
jgi:hypothetical protein